MRPAPYRILAPNGAPLGRLGALGWVVPVLRATAWAASGVAAFDYFSEDEIQDLWADSSTFNTIGSRLNQQFEMINAALSKCGGAWNQESTPFRTEWRAWSEWWGAEGDRFTDAGKSAVDMLRDFAVRANGWAIRVGHAIQAHCPEQFERYPWKSLVDLQVDPNTGTVTEQQKAHLKEVELAAQAARHDPEAVEAERWSRLISGVGWVLAGGITIGVLAFGYRIYKDVRKK